MLISLRGDPGSEPAVSDVHDGRCGSAACVPPSSPLFHPPPREVRDSPERAPYHTLSTKLGHLAGLGVKHI